MASIERPPWVPSLLHWALSRRNLSIYFLQENHTRRLDFTWSIAIVQSKMPVL